MHTCTYVYIYMYVYIYIYIFLYVYFCGHGLFGGEDSGGVDRRRLLTAEMALGKVFVDIARIPDRFLTQRLPRVFK